jgi:toxin YoeB
VPIKCTSFGEEYVSHFIEDLDYWKSEDPKVAERIRTLVKDTIAHPFTGLGKPEPLKYIRPDLWSRRITKEDRLSYLVRKNTVTFIQCRYHYDDLVKVLRRLGLGQRP